MKLEPTSAGFTVDANDLGPLLGIPPADVPGLMRQGKITCLSEKGQGTDAGRFRVTFRYATVRIRFTVDEAGNVLFQSRIVGP
jgi:hypothetical protein